MSFDDLIKKSPQRGTGLVLEDYNYTMIDGFKRRIHINYQKKTILVTGESGMKQEWIVDRFRDIYETHQKSGTHSPFRSVGKMAVIHKGWSVGIDYGNGNIHNIGKP